MSSSSMSFRSSDDNISALLSQLSDGSQAKRTKAITDLTTYLNLPKSSEGLKKDSQYHRLLDSLFRAALAAKQTELTAKRARKSDEQNATNAAKAVAATVLHGLPKLKPKTVQAVIDHIIETLPGRDGILYEPFANEYFSLLGRILSHGPHAETLASDGAQGWLSCVDFCVFQVSQYFDGHTQDSAPSRAGTPGPSIGASSSLGRSNGRYGSQLHTAGPTHGEALMQCLLHLINTSNAPLWLRLSNVSRASLQMLRSKQSPRPVHRVTLAILNRVLQSTYANDTKLGLQLTDEVVPVLAYWWSQSLKDGVLPSNVRHEVLNIIFGLRLYFQRCASETGHENLVTDATSLLETMQAYQATKDRRLNLRIDDVCFDIDELHSTPFTTDNFALRPYDVSLESKWATVDAMAILEGFLYRHQHSVASQIAAVNDNPRKRRKLHTATTTIHDRLRSRDPGTRLTMLQTLPLFLARNTLGWDELSSLVDDLTSLIADKDHEEWSWAMLACTSCAMQARQHVDQADCNWLLAWQRALRSVSNTSTCRSACVLLRVILQLELLPLPRIAEDINNMITMADVCGPAIVVDSSLLLMRSLLLQRDKSMPGASNKNAKYVIRWLFSAWHPGTATYATGTLPNLSYSGIVGLYGSIVKIARPSRAAVAGIGGPLSRSRQEYEAYTQLARMLLLAETEGIADYSGGSSKLVVGSDASAVSPDQQSIRALQTLVLDLLLSKLTSIVDTVVPLTDLDTESKLQVSVTTTRCFLSCLCTATLLLPHLQELQSDALRDLEALTTQLRDLVCHIVTRTSDINVYQAVLLAMQEIMPGLQTTYLENYCQENPHALALLAQMSSSIRTRRSAQHSYDEDGVAGPEVDQVLDILDWPRDVLTLSLTSNAYEQDVTLRIELIAKYAEDQSQIGLLPESFITALTTLSHRQFLSSKAFLMDALQSDIIKTPDVAIKLVEKLGVIIADNEFCSSEVALCCCIDIIRLLLPTWANATDEALDMVGDVYNHLLKSVYVDGLLSPIGQVALGNLQYRLMESGSQLHQRAGVTSPRSTLLTILRDGPSNVKFGLGNRLPSIFELFVLRTHDDIFVDVLDSLPTAPDDFEGIILRLDVLKKLACACPTLLRRCVYHISETSASVASCAMFASLCFTQIAKMKQLESRRQLFRLFAPQLLFTWLDGHKVDAIPFDVFGFDSLDDLLAEYRSEAMALMLMRGQDDALTDLAKRLKISPAQLAQQSFTRAYAYAVASDLTHAKKQAQGTCENKLRKILGREAFQECVETSFVDILATFLDLIDQEDDVDAIWRKDPATVAAAQNMAHIKKLGHSPVGLPPNQQPVFKAKYLTREIAHLLDKTHFDVSTIWTPPLVVLAARKLLDSIHPALGPLHACSAIRKLRVLVALSGDCSTKSYPLEMLLHSLRTSLMNVECAEDAMGLTHWLIEKGSDHLVQSPSFLAGYAVPTLASLRMFMESSQPSTTQESHFKATRSKAQQFHDWLVRYLSGYDSTRFASDEQRHAFRSIIDSASSICAAGTSTNGTSEGKLLLGVLEDSQRSHPLLNDSSRVLVLRMLCGDFQASKRMHDDIVNNDKDASALANAVWKSCATSGLSDNYLSWAGLVIGRSFAASGRGPHGMAKETQKRVSKVGSDQALVSLISGHVSSDDSTNAGLAESALRKIVSDAIALDDGPFMASCRKSLTGSLYASSDWAHFKTPPSEYRDMPSAGTNVFEADAINQAHWARNLASYLTAAAGEDIILSVLPPMITSVQGFAELVMPYVVHLVLLSQLDTQQTVRRDLSEALKGWFCSQLSVAGLKNTRLLLETLLYLQTERMPNETSMADRLRWLDVDFGAAAETAASCGMFRVALMFTEVASTSVGRTSRRSSINVVPEGRNELLLTIFQNVDDPDAFYGLNQTASLMSVIARLQYEKDGSKALAFRGAQYDSRLRQRESAAVDDGLAIVEALSGIGLAGVSRSVLHGQDEVDGQSTSLSSMYDDARKLETWNLTVTTEVYDPAATAYKAYQAVSKAVEINDSRQQVRDEVSSSVRNLMSRNHNSSELRRQLVCLATLSELDDALGLQGPEDLDQLLHTQQQRSEWMLSGRYEDVGQILSRRETTLSLLSQGDILRVNAKLTAKDARLAEMRSMTLSSSVHRVHHATQETLNIATSMTHRKHLAEAAGLKVDATTSLEVANALWDQGEMVTSIRMLQDVNKTSNLSNQDIPLGRADLLSKIAHQVSIARLEGPGTIQKQYLEPALKELRGKSEGAEAGQVFHQFAKFCDEQLQNPDSLEDLARLQSLKRGKNAEVVELNNLMNNAKETQTRNRYAHHLAKAKQWLDLDQQELTRVEKTRNEFVKLSLENYLLSLAASDKHNNDALRFIAMWLERSDEDLANEVVKKLIDRVPSRKLAHMVNQLTSRLQDQQTVFQTVLINLISRICTDHPYHGMYTIWSSTKTKANTKDAVAMLRRKASERIALHLAKQSRVDRIWRGIDRTSISYHMLAVDKGDKYKSGLKIALAESSGGEQLQASFQRYQIPPPTMQIPLSPSKDYSQVPTVVKFEPLMTIASGVSAPKIVTALGSNGERFKQLVKGGNDDLRQDAIMEQVFAAVSELLKQHTSARQRNLGIRTYKVLPLTSTSGLIEFVANTMPLHDFLMPAHERYNPKDLKGSQCRKEISAVQTKSVEVRLSQYRKVTERFSPVMRWFFLESFSDPDDWYERRLAYTRSTAAISILGHVLGLGDRHGHNILLDKHTGEAVHIDLGVAFEMGRVLPVPELVPFRMTRDIVDGMGITGTEGVFRRCCEFTLDALREDSDSIMTILDVLRYDPLYSWSMSPVRIAKLQDARSRTAPGEEGEGNAPSVIAKNGEETSGDANGQQQEPRKVVNEPSEADRALEVVRKKLSKTLSVAATVNDLINQATDERNLAVLYSGWAAYA